MFDVGFAELFLLALIGLVILGPERLPSVARTLGGFVRKARASWISLRNTIQSELNEGDFSTPVRKTSEELKQIGKDLADMTGFKPGKGESISPELKPDAATDQKSEPVKDPGTGKDENA